MIFRHITDWDDAYANGANIPSSERWPDAWTGPAREFRNEMLSSDRAKLDIEYGPGARNRLDLFLPDGTPKGLVVFVHGGFWRVFDKSTWSHLAAGAVGNGHAVAMPSYTLCPETRISGITREIGAAIEKAAAMVGGPIRLTGHSAGGHLVTRMISATSPLSAETRARVVHTLSLSGVHDLRPLIPTAMNADLKIDMAEARTESPALLEPMENARLTCWAGGNERAEFLRQNALLANVWTGLGAATAVVEEADRHHFNVIDGLADPAHDLTLTLLTG